MDLQRIFEMVGLDVVCMAIGGHNLSTCRATCKRIRDAIVNHGQGLSEVLYAQASATQDARLVTRTMGLFLKNEQIQIEGLRRLIGMLPKGAHIPKVMSSDNEEAKKGLQAQYEAIGESGGGLKAAKLALTAHPASVEVHKETCKLLRDVCRVDATRHSAIEMKMVEAIVEGMKKHPDDWEVQEWSCRVMCNLSFGDNSLQQMGDAIAETAMVYAKRAIGTHMAEHPEVAERGCAFLVNLVMDPTGHDAAEAMDLETTVIAAVRTHPRHEGVQREGLFLLSELIDEPTEELDAIGMAAMEAYPKDAEIRESAMMLLLH